MSLPLVEANYIPVLALLYIRTVTIKRALIYQYSVHQHSLFSFSLAETTEKSIPEEQEDFEPGEVYWRLYSF